MIHLYVLSCVLSRVNSKIDADGEEKSAHERQIAKAFAARTESVIAAAAQEIDTNADDAVKSVADRAFDLEGYSFDTL